ncbi:MAG: FAD-dependent oxidoreductase [Pirellulaceae bacterium]
MTKLTRPDAIVVGSGLSGLSCAYRLAAAGRKVLVLEASDVLGGRTASWVQDGMPVESGLHKFLGVYRELPRLLRDVGVRLNDMLTWVDEAAIHTPDGKLAVFGAAPYHRPLRTLWGALANNHLIPLRDKLRLAAMGVAGIRDYWRRPLELDRVSLAEYAAKFGVSSRVIQDVLLAMTSGVFFLPVEEYSAYATFSPMAEGLKRGMTFRIGAFKGGMTDVMIRPIVAAIEKLGGEVVAGSGVSELIVQGNRVAGVVSDKTEVFASDTVIATTLMPAQDLVRSAFSDHPSFQPMLSLPSVSAVTVQFELNAPALDSDRTNFSPTTLACFGEQSRTTFRETSGRLSCILYPPTELISASPEATASAAIQAASSLGIAPRVTRFRVVNHPNEFYAMRPGTEALRPTAETAIDGLWLAGDYTRQPFLASMEGATISGFRAAEAILAKS